MTEEERFWSKVDRGGPVARVGLTACWVWTASIGSTGYGQIWLSASGRKHYKSHRLAWQFTHGAIPDGMCVLHRCDNRCCVNPEHLFLGTNLDNIADRVAKGRNHDITGEKNPRARLSENEVLAIRASLERDRVLSKRYGVSYSLISQIRNRYVWKHI